MFRKKQEKPKLQKLFEVDSEMEELCKKAEAYKEYKRKTKNANFFRHVANGIENGEISVDSYSLEWGAGGILTIELVSQPEISKVLKDFFYG